MQISYLVSAGFRVLTTEIGGNGGLSGIFPGEDTCAENAHEVNPLVIEKIVLDYFQHCSKTWSQNFFRFGKYSNNRAPILLV